MEYSMTGSLRHLFIFILSLSVSYLRAELTCLECSDVPNPRGCGRVRRCGSHEACFIESYATSSGAIKYNIGCRDTQFCGALGRRSATAVLTSLETEITSRNSSEDDMWRASGNIKICESCCNSTLCNSGGCGATGYLPRQNRGPVCYTCAQQRTPESCDTITQCGKNSVCQVKFGSTPTTGDLYYSSKCIDPQVCHQEVVFNSLIIGRKRLTEEVDTGNHKCVQKCCDADLCNGQCGSGSVVPGKTDPCASNPCVNGTCSVSQGAYVCTCQSGATGRNCDTYPCASNPCIHGTCSVSQGTYVCICQGGATGRNCDTLPNYCLSNPCLYGTCRNLATGYQCQCNSGYLGTNCDMAQNACSSHPCKHGTCHNQGTSYSCACSYGYTGTNCDQVINACLSNPCHNGRCLSRATTYQCACDSGYTGANCGQVLDACSSNPCQYGLCHIQGASYRCTCNTGYTGFNCDQVQTACSSSPCQHGQCHIQGASYQCTCVNGYTGTNCDQVLTACSSSPCQHGRCHIQGASYQCTCDNGYTGTNCDQVLTACSSSPCQHGQCHIQGASYQCTCDNGYTGTNCDQVQNACLSNPCQHGTCHTVGSGYHCTCNRGYTGINCGQEVNCYYKSKAYRPGEIWQDGCNYNCSCVCENAGCTIVRYICDDLCIKYIHVPAGCVLKKDFGECCAKPDCSNQGSSNITTGCFYGHTVHKEGEEWQDGCDNSCRCLNGTSGLYRCHPLCLSWKLPPVCNLVPPAAGKCCSTPSCPSYIQIQYPPGYHPGI